MLHELLYVVFYMLISTATEDLNLNIT